MENLNIIVVFLEGIISFFSPCVIPILPLYFSYLSTNAQQNREDGTIYYKQSKIFLYTLFFIFGISTAFFLLGFAFTSFGHLFRVYQYPIAFISGIIILFFGCMQLGIVHLPFHGKEFRLKNKINIQKMNLGTSFLLGFTFSFAWTPCVGPTLSSVLLLAANTSTLLGMLYIGVYALGFLLPFLGIGLFTTPILNFIKKKQSMIQYTIKIAGFMIIMVGISLIYNNGKQLFHRNYELGNLCAEDCIDQYGKHHHLKEYQDKIILLTFLDSTCLACKQEMPILEELYQEYQRNKKDVVIIGILKVDQISTDSQLEQFFEKNQYSYPIIKDVEQKFQNLYHVHTYPSTIILNKGGIVEQEFIGTISKELIKEKMNQLKNDCPSHIC